MKHISRLLIIASILLLPVFAVPQTAEASNHSRCRGSTGFLSFPTWYEYLDVDADCNVSAVRYKDGSNAVNIGATVGAILLAITEILLRIAGIVAVGFIIYGGIQLTMSQGAPDKIQASRQIIMNGIIGLVIAVLAVSIVNLISNIVVG